MADRTPDQLTSLTTAADNDLVLIYDMGASLLKKQTFLQFIGQVLSGLGGSLLSVANNLSDVASASASRANLGLGTAATLASSAVCQTANNLSDVASPTTARTNLGAAASASPTITGGITYSGSQKGNVMALSGTDIDVSTAEGFTKSINTNTTFTFSGVTAGKLQGFVLELTISSGAVPTFPASVDLSSGVAPTFVNGKHILGFITLDGGTSWTLVLLGFNVS